MQFIDRVNDVMFWIIFTVCVVTMLVFIVETVVFLSRNRSEVAVQKEYLRTHVGRHTIMLAALVYIASSNLLASALSAISYVVAVVCITGGEKRHEE